VEYKIFGISHLLAEVFEYFPEHRFSQVIPIDSNGRKEWKGIHFVYRCPQDHRVCLQPEPCVRKPGSVNDETVAYPGSGHHHIIRVQNYGIVPPFADHFAMTGFDEDYLIAQVNVSRHRA
jgi:hypothetical protein